MDNEYFPEPLAYDEDEDEEEKYFIWNESIALLTDYSGITIPPYDFNN